MVSPEVKVQLITFLLRYGIIPIILTFIVGWFKISSFFFSFFRLIVQTFIWPGTSLKKFGAKKGAWAVITGPTEGIGMEFALQLGQAGFNIVLLARNPEKLASVAKEIESKYNVSTKTFVIDFTKRDEKVYDALAELLAPLDIGVLVNNVGRSHEMPVDFVDTTIQEMESIVDINIHSLLRVTHIIAPLMINRKRGLILNLSSMAGSVPSAMLATYSGSKGFVATFTQCLGSELKPHGITVQLLNTYFVVSAMSKIRKPTIMVPMPKPYVRACLSHIGLQCGSLGKGPYLSTVYWSHAAFDWILTQMGLIGIYIRVNHRMHKDIRRRALRKKERLAAAAAAASKTE